MAAALVAVLATATPALAAAALDLSVSSGVLGASVTASASGFPEGPVTFRWDNGQLLGTAAANAQGDAQLTFNVPGTTALGSHFVRACATNKCPQGTIYADAAFTVVTPPTPPPTQPPTAPPPTAPPTPRPTAAPTKAPTAPPVPNPTPPPGATPRPTVPPSSIAPSTSPDPSAAASGLPTMDPSGSADPTFSTNPLATPAPSATPDGGATVTPSTDGLPTGGLLAGPLLPVAGAGLLVMAGAVFFAMRRRSPKGPPMAVVSAEVMRPRTPRDVHPTDRWNPAARDVVVAPTPPRPPAEPVPVAEPAPPSGPGSPQPGPRTISIRVQQLPPEPPREP